MRGVSPVPREGVGNLPPAAARRLYPTLRVSAVRHGAADVRQQRIFGVVESGAHRAELAKLLDASDAQMDYVSDAPAGHGLIKVGSCLVPFINELPRDTELYRLMTTKPGEQNA